MITARFVDKFAGDLRRNLRIYGPDAVEMFILHRNACRDETLGEIGRELFGAPGVPTQLGQRHKYWMNGIMRRQASVTAVTMSTATAATAATAASFFARVAVIARAGGSEGRKFLVQPRGAAVRTFRALPFGGANENFGIAFALGAMKFVNRHGAKIVGAAEMFKRGRSRSFKPLHGETLKVRKNRCLKAAVFVSVNTNGAVLVWMETQSTRLVEAWTT